MFPRHPLQVGVATLLTVGTIVAEGYRRNIRRNVSTVHLARANVSTVPHPGYRGNVPRSGYRGNIPLLASDLPTVGTGECFHVRNVSTSDLRVYRGNILKCVHGKFQRVYVEAVFHKVTVESLSGGLGSA